MSGADSNYMTCTAAELPDFISEAWADDVRPIVHGQPGLGKSQIAYQVAARLGLPVWELRLAQRDPTALTGFHMPDLAAGVMRYLPGEDWPAVPCVAFLDELNRAAMLTQNAAFEFLDFGRAGGRTLAAGSHIMAAVNYMSDGGGVQKMASAIGNRFRHFHLEVNVDAWLDWALGAGVHPLVIGYQRWRQSNGDSAALLAFSATEDAWPSPRSWERVSRACHRGAAGRSLLAAACGDVGVARGTEFAAYAELYRSCPSIDAILISPDTAPIPTDLSALYAVSAALAARSTDATFGRVMTYMERLPGEYIAFVAKDATARPAGHGPSCQCGPCARVDGLVHCGDYSAAMIKHRAVFGG